MWVDDIKCNLGCIRNRRAALFGSTILNWPPFLSALNCHVSSRTPLTDTCTDISGGFGTKAPIELETCTIRSISRPSVRSIQHVELGFWPHGPGAGCIRPPPPAQEKPIGIAWACEIKRRIERDMLRYRLDHADQDLEFNRAAKNIVLANQAQRTAALAQCRLRIRKRAGATR